MNNPNELPFDNTEFSTDEIAPIPLAFQEGGKLYAPIGAALPTEVCICCGRKNLKTIHKTIRNPKDLRTWFGNISSFDVGLCKKHSEDYNIALALTFSAFGIGLFLLGVGAFTMSLTPIILGLLSISVCGIFRARLPIYSPAPQSDQIEIKGACTKFLSLIPEMPREMI